MAKVIVGAGHPGVQKTRQKKKQNVNDLRTTSNYQYQSRTNHYYQERQLVATGSASSTPRDSSTLRKIPC